MALFSDRAIAIRGLVSRPGLKLAFVLTFAAVAGLASDRKLLGFVQALELCSFFVSVGAICRALIRREQPEGPRISGWDEAVGFGLVTLLAHISIRFVG
ncbi:MAG: hypothetical protein JWL84_2551 [Rhodospirillales bacterium]|nr:hypothetical protein [Rhodospirillales bacterium]